MIHLRSFRPSDWQTIVKYQHPDMEQADVLKLIDDFNAPTYKGKFHKFLAIVHGQNIVGYVSLIETAGRTVSVGAEVYTPFQRQGYAYAGISQLLTMANAYDYHTAIGHVRKDNAASLGLCKKLGFTITGEGISKRGHPIYSLARSI